MWWVLLLETADAAAWVFRPLDPGVGFRVGDQNHLDVTVQPVLSWQRSQLEIDDEEGDPTRLLNLGAAIDVVGRFGFAASPSRVSWVVGGRASVTQSRMLGSVDDTIGPSERLARLWSGPGVTLAVNDRWSVGADLEAVSGSVSSVRSNFDNPGLGIAITTDDQRATLGLFTGGHVWFSFRPR